MIKSTTALVRAVRDQGIIGSLTRIDENKVHSGMSCDLPVIYKVCKDNGITYQPGGGYIVLTFPAK